MAGPACVEGPVGSMSDLRVNKIAGAVLATGLVVLGLRTVSEALFTVEQPEKPGYAITIQEAAAEGGAAVADTPPDWGTVLPIADVAAGQTVSGKCASCHTFDKGGADGTGPNLWGVMGRKPGSKAGYAYSPAMTGEAGKIPAWDYEHLYEYLKAPQAYVQGTKMTFVGLKKTDERVNLIAWLRMQNDSPAAIPAPNPAAAAPAAAEGAKPAEGAAAPVAAGAAAANPPVGPTPAATPPSGAKPNPGA